MDAQIHMALAGKMVEECRVRGDDLIVLTHCGTIVTVCFDERGPQLVGSAIIIPRREYGEPTPITRFLSGKQIAGVCVNGLGQLVMVCADGHEVVIAPDANGRPAFLRQNCRVVVPIC